MHEPKPENKQNIGYYRFRLTTTVLYFTGMRLQEVGNLTEQQLFELIETQRTQIFMPKKHRFIAIPEQAQDILKQNKFENKIVFDFSQQKTQVRTIRYTTKTKNDFNNFLAWYNQQLKFYLMLMRVDVRLNDQLLFQNVKLLSSHSFRINKITQTYSTYGSC